MIGLLSGRAAQWAKAVSSKLLSLRQGAGSVADYSIQFRILAAESGWDQIPCRESSFEDSQTE